MIFAPKNLTQDDSGSLVISRNKKKLYVLKGLKDYMVIDTEDALMICPRNDEDYQDIISDLGMPDYEDFR